MPDIVATGLLALAEEQRAGGIITTAIRTFLECDGRSIARDWRMSG